MRGRKDAFDPVLTDIVRGRLAHIRGEDVPRRAQSQAQPSDQPVPNRPQVAAPMAAGGRAADPPGEPSGHGGDAPAAGYPGLATVGSRQRSFGRRHLGVITGLLLMGVLFTGWSVLRARPVALATTPDTTATVVATGAGGVTPRGSGTAASPMAGSPVASQPARTAILVHVLGPVRRPGVVRLPQGARVLDALKAAGGLRGDADPGELNLAQILTDGEQIAIGTKKKPVGEVRDGSEQANGADPGKPTPGDAQQLNLNTATEAQLEHLPSVGPVTAGKIVAWRQAHGRFSRVEELQEVDGIGPKTYAQIAPHVLV
jgi:competence protein ComEA